MTWRRRKEGAAFTRSIQPEPLARLHINERLSSLAQTEKDRLRAKHPHRSSLLNGKTNIGRFVEIPREPEILDEGARQVELQRACLTGPQHQIAILKISI